MGSSLWKEVILIRKGAILALYIRGGVQSGKGES